MKRTVLGGAVLAMGLGLAAVAYFQGGGVAEAQEADAPVVGTLSSMEDGLTWGMTHNDVIRVYNSVGGLFDREYDPKLAKTQPGVQMAAIEADRENRKTAFAASFLEFKDIPTGYDATGVKDEYTYRNHESVMSVDKDGKRRYLFFIGSPPSERLWKLYDEYPVRPGGVYGASYPEAVAKLRALVGGVAPRVQAPGAASRVTSSDWQDAVTHLRIDDRTGDGVVGVVLEDKRTLSNLPQLRSVKVVDPFALDPSVAAITRGGLSDPNAARAAAADAGTPKKKKK
jgi:hypothetical protein